ncbi:class I SAM-dependent RNA methyltransferase [Jannaschia seohaensis]|uniref:23S rRNA (Uracil1939-C5)-methyltransferase n=1 Tax=Jannaschia seohaensis TaxID=475081 RepID=A0A2Y9B1F1_9RHOB|nr:class I SAM-dependent RNA methyltransferase [Jannaschia seohaensis]PWJ16520.1 23S rRNA (uracil1939-C5)-methyltransferase [Jannaschia seohaensis]SSA48757.1 23S rRNA (uracil1939-C5)-methyltransferase [Jannaschia seohaensis]
MPVLTVETLGARGDGVAGGVYVPRSLPGEVVTGEIVGDRMPDPKIVTPSPDRVAPPCPHFRRCGGCALQHASDGFVAEWKVEIVRGALARAGIESEVASVETSPPATRRRAALSGRKTKKGAQVGFHVRGSDEIVSIPECHVLHPALLAALPSLEAITRMAAARGTEITLQLTRTETGLDLALDGAKPLDRAAMSALAPLAAGFARITWNGEPALQQLPPRLTLGRAPVTPPPGAFLQATEAGEAALVARVRDGLGAATAVVDLFAGMGTFTFPAAERARVHAVEGDPALIAALEQGARQAQGLKPVTGQVRDLFRDPLTAAELSRYEAVIIDPPRAGAAAQVAELARADLSRIAYVSCNPATFARDAAMLTEAGWRLGPVTVVDQFRWSAHIELAATFERP